MESKSEATETERVAAGTAEASETPVRSRGKSKKNGSGKTNGSRPAPAEPEEKPGKTKLEFESFLSRDEAAAYFEAIVKGLRQGSIHFHQRDEHLTLCPTEHVGIAVKAARKSGREKLTFELAWRTDTPELTIVAG